MPGGSPSELDVEEALDQLSKDSSLLFDSIGYDPSDSEVEAALRMFEKDTPPLNGVDLVNSKIDELAYVLTNRVSNSPVTSNLFLIPPQLAVLTQVTAVLFKKLDKIDQLLPGGGNRQSTLEDEESLKMVLAMSASPVTAHVSESIGSSTASTPATATSAIGTPIQFPPTPDRGSLPIPSH